MRKASVNAINKMVESIDKVFKYTYNLELIWSIIQNDLPSLKNDLKIILVQLENN